MGQITEKHEWDLISNNEHEIILYFNEPERAGIAVQDAVDLWLEKMVPLRKGAGGKKLVSPACASDPPGEAWLAEFMRKIEAAGEAPDYLGLHYYGTESKGAIEYVERM